MYWFSAQMGMFFPQKKDIMPFFSVKANRHLFDEVYERGILALAINPIVSTIIFIIY
jgi:hypothetical protein